MIIIYITAALIFVFYLLHYNCRKSVESFFSNSKKGNSKTPEDLKIAYEPVFFDTSDEIEISGWFIESRKPSSDVFLIFGDGFITKSDLLDSTIFLSENYNLLYFDLRGSGTSRGKYSFGFNEHRDIEAAYRFVKDVKNMGNVYLYLCGFSYVSVFFISDDINISGAIIKKPVFDMIKEIEKLIKSKYRVLICGSVINKFIPQTIRSFSSDPSKLKFPVIFISGGKHSGGDNFVYITNDDEIKSLINDFFKH